MQYFIVLTIVLLCWTTLSLSAEILMITLGGTKSHKIPFKELAVGLILRGHNVTLLSGFPSHNHMDGLHEISPGGLTSFIGNYTNWDLLGARMSGQMPVSLWDAVRYAFQSCDAMLNDVAVSEVMRKQFDLAVLDGAFPECALGIVYQIKIPFMYINTVGFYTGSLMRSGNPASFATTPNFHTAFTENMSLFERVANTSIQLFQDLLHRFVIRLVHGVICKYFGSQIPHPYAISRNVSFILQNGHAVVSYPRAYYPHVAEIACIHCKSPKILPKDLEEFIQSSGHYGFIYVSMGSSVKAANMPVKLRQLLLKTFSHLPYRVLWKYEGNATEMDTLSDNIKIQRWLPQQDILGHKKLRAFITHGGLLSLFETVYHGVPIVTIPVFCDHDVNSAKAQSDGYAIKIDLASISCSQLYKAIMKIIHEPQYRNSARFRQNLFLDQRNSPLETSIYWTEYVLRHKGAVHLQSPARKMGWIQYYIVDVMLIYLAILCIVVEITRRVLWRRNNRVYEKSIKFKNT